MTEYNRMTDKKQLQKVSCYNCEYNFAGSTTCERYCIDGEYFELRREIAKLIELEDKIENGTLAELDESLIGEEIIGIHEFTDGTYQLDLDENIVIGFAVNGVVTWNNKYQFNDEFRNGMFFMSNEKDKAKAKLKELRGE